MSKRYEAERRHALYYANRLDAYGTAYDAGERQSVLEGFEEDWAQIRQGHEWSLALVAANDVSAGLAVTYQARGQRLLELRRPPIERIRWLDPAMQVLERVDRGAYAEVLNLRASAAAAAGDFTGALDFYQRAIAIARQALADHTDDDNYWTQQCGGYLKNLGAAYQSVGRFDEAIATYEEALNIARARKDRKEEGSVLGNLAIAYAEHGEDNRSVPLYQDALAFARESNATDDEENWTGNLGNTYVELGQIPEGIANLEQALAMARNRGDRSAEGLRLRNLASAYLKLGQPERALAAQMQGLAIARDLGTPAAEAHGLHGLGMIYDRLGQSETAIQHFVQAADAYSTLGLPHLAERALLNVREIRARPIRELVAQGNAELAQGRLQTAFDTFSTGLQISRDIGHSTWESLCLGNLATIYQQADRHDLAIGLLNTALEIDDHLSNPALRGRHLANLADSYRMLHELDRARELYDRALQQLHDIQDQQALAAMILGSQGSIALEQNRPGDARRYFESSLTVFASLQMTAQVAHTREMLAMLDDTKA